MRPLNLTVATCLLASIVPNIALANDQLTNRVAKNEAQIENLQTEINLTKEKVKQKANLFDVNSRFGEVHWSLDRKADKDDVEAGMAKKADKTYVDAKLVEKADKAELAKKADQSYVDGKLNEKADKTELAKKADQSYVDGKLSEKADKTALSALDLRVKQNQEAIASLKPANIEGLKARTAKLEASVSKLNAQVQSNTQRLDKLNEELKRGLATQAALSGLFQPYSVGKFNVTAAVGGYQSKSAVAVGAGYRFNAHFAAKAGVAMSTGDNNASYNVGVNYEF